MTRPDWDDYFYAIARVIASRSTCPRKQVGAILVKDRRVLTTGYNGAPPGAAHCIDVGCDMVDDHCIRTVHAEVNVIAQAAKYGANVEGATLYCTLEPCHNCEKIIWAAGINDIRFDEPYRPYD